MYIYIHTCIYVYIYIYICIHTHTHTHKHKHFDAVLFDLDYLHQKDALPNKVDAHNQSGKI